MHYWLSWREWFRDFIVNFILAPASPSFSLPGKIVFLNAFNCVKRVNLHLEYVEGGRLCTQKRGALSSWFRDLGTGPLLEGMTCHVGTLSAVPCFMHSRWRRGCMTGHDRPAPLQRAPACTPHTPIQHTRRWAADAAVDLVRATG